MVIMVQNNDGGTVELQMVFNFAHSVVLATVLHYNKVLLIYSLSSETKKRPRDGKDFINFRQRKMPNCQRQSEY